MSQIKPAEVSAILKKQLTGLDASASLDEVGTVLQVGDGIASIKNGYYFIEDFLIDSPWILVAAIIFLPCFATGGDRKSVV